jgi:hypothetical protein
MARVADKDRTVFEEMYKTVLENFTPHDMMQIEEMASSLRDILKDAKRRLDQDMDIVCHRSAVVFPGPASVARA